MRQKTRRVGVIAYRNADGSFQNAREIGKYPGPEMDPEEESEAIKAISKFFLEALMAAEAGS